MVLGEMMVVLGLSWWFDWLWVSVVAVFGV